MLYNDALISTLWGEQLLAVARLLASNRDFFELSSAQRKEKTAQFSVWLQPYLVSTSEADFLSDTQAFFAGQTVNSGLLQALTDYYLRYFVLLVDNLPERFGSLSFEEKVKVVGGLELMPSEAEVLAKYSFSQIELSVDNLFRKLTLPGEPVLVELPKPIDASMKKEIRTKYAGDVVFFHVKSSLLGGMRVLKGGKVLDYSWSEKINHISQKLNVF